mmetsp:Transcript_107653/g.347454  ORF Transcript_107653/g.347454 Transcript_107653/m.347454 type:complete len:688 (+) Transcript_107653:61-2124(+)
MAVWVFALTSQRGRTGSRIASRVHGLPAGNRRRQWHRPAHQQGSRSARTPGDPASCAVLAAAVQLVCGRRPRRQSRAGALSAAAVRGVDILSFLDEDGDENLDVNEIRTGLRMLGLPLTNDQGDVAQQIMELLDTDGDGFISQAEWKQYVEQPEASSKGGSVKNYIRGLESDLGQFEDIVRYAFTFFDENDDGQISVEEFNMACRAMGMQMPPEVSQRLFAKLSGGKGYILQTELEANPWESFRSACSSALAEQYKNKGLEKAEYVVGNVMASMMQTDGDVVQKLRAGTHTLWIQAENLSDLMLFILDVVSISLALSLLAQELDCMPDCWAQLDVANLVPFVIFLRKVISDVLKEVSDGSISDLNRDNAFVFATVFKPAGFSVSSFQQLNAQGGAQWRTLPRGQRLPYAAATQVLQLVVRGSLEVITQDGTGRFTEQSEVLEPGFFLGAAEFSRVGEGLKDGGKCYLHVRQDVLLLTWDAGKLRLYLEVHEDQRQLFSMLLARSLSDNMATVQQGISRQGVQLRELLRDLLLGMRRTVRAEHATIWVHDPGQRILWAVLPSERGSKVLAIADSHGLAGHTFTHNEVLRLQDCYADPRFSTEVDEQTGSRTRNTLCFPVVGKGGEAVGVLQLVNKERASRFCFCGFTAADERNIQECLWLVDIVIRRLAKRYAASQVAGHVPTEAGLI